jgi:hypothetical protein
LRDGDHVGRLVSENVFKQELTLFQVPLQVLEGNRADRCETGQTRRIHFEFRLIDSLFDFRPDGRIIGMDQPDVQLGNPLFTPAGSVWSNCRVMLQCLCLDTPVSLLDDRECLRVATLLNQRDEIA